MTEQSIRELLDKWAEIQKRAKSERQTVGSAQQRISEELSVLESLRAAGCSQIPGEPFDVAFMIEDRRRLSREMRDRHSGF